MTVSTSAQLLHCLQLDDFIYGVVGTQASAEKKQADNGFKLWNIPGMGLLGVGAGTAALIAFYAANKESLNDTLDNIGDVFGDKDRDTRLDATAELLGKKGLEYDPGAPDPPDGEPRIAKSTPIPLPEPKAEHKPVEQVTVPSAGRPAATPIQAPAAPPAVTPVSKGSQVPGSKVPAHTLARPTVEINDILQNTAKSEGVDYRTLYALAGSESSFRAGANADSSSAVGLFQFTAPTWNYLTTKVYPELGYGPGDRMDPAKSAVMGAKYVKSIRASLRKKLGRDPSLGETYLGYFMGPTGAQRFIDALKANPDAKGPDVFPSAAEANPNLFYNKGKRDQPLTLAQTMSRLEGKVEAYAEQAGTVKTTTAKTEVLPPIQGQGGPQPVPVAANIPASASPQPVPVPAPDFTAAKAGAKGEARDQQQPDQPKSGQQSSGTQVATTSDSKPKQSGEVSYVRDKQGRLVTIRS